MRPIGYTGENAEDSEGWEEEFDRQTDLYDARLLDEDAFLDKEKVKSFIRTLLAQREAEVAEKVKRVSYELVSEFRDRLIDIAIENEHMRGCVTSNQINQAFSDFEASQHPALSTLSDKPSV